MKTSSFLTLFLILNLIVAVGCVPQENRPQSPTALTSSALQIAVTPENIQFLDYHFNSIDPTDPRLKKSISQDQALKSALEFEPRGKNAKSISTHVGYFDNIPSIDLQNKRLVWLVTYYGVDTVSSGPPGSNHFVTQTLTVAVDAFQGVGIVSMTLAVITPEPDVSKTAISLATERNNSSSQVRETITGIPSLALAVLTTPVPSNTGLTIEENEIKGSIDLEPLTFQPVYGTQDEVIARHAQSKQGESSMVSDRENNHFVYYPLTGGKQYRAIEIVSGATAVKGGGKIANLTVQVLRDDQVIFTTSAGQVSPISSFRGLWVDGSNWYLEIAFVMNTINGNAVFSNPIGRIYKDGVLLNETYSYDEMFGFQLLDGNPFYFYKKDGTVHVSYNNHDLPLTYDEIHHYRCCSGAAVNPIAAPNWLGFFGRKNDIWYYTEIGQYDTP